ncbi:GGDEF domain-containing protein [[Clostridium] innocuum]|nr:GGDEF domain-containing protein [[Clostridium] innocuum]MCR0576779.1 GGDEF domain-containing protein [[Clostridium] innocuum]
MKIETIGIQNDHKQVPGQAISESMMMELEIGFSKHRLDDGLTFIWGNAAFYRLTGIAKNEFCTRYSDFRTYYGSDLRCICEYESMHQQLCKAYEAGAKSISHQLRIKGRLSCSWIKLTAFFCTLPDQTPGAYFMYTDISAMMKKQQELEERENNFAWMLSVYAGNVYISDMDTYELLYLNAHACNTLQANAETVIGEKCYKVIQGRTSPCPFCTNHRLKKDETYEWEFYNPNLQRTFMIKDRMLNWKGHRARLELSYDMYSAEYKLAKKDQERESILKTIPAGMIRIDARDYRTVLWYNDIFLNMIEYTKEQFENELHSRCTYMHPDDYKRVQLLAQDLKESGENVVLEARAYTRSKKERIWTTTLCYISGEDSWDGIPSFYSLSLDITKERKKMETLQHKAEKDSLTGIYNRAETEKQIKEYLVDNLHAKGALFMIDTDNFKQINDTEGHMVGDVVLAELANGMKRLMRESDIVGRIGGDEFTIFMKNIASLKDAERKAQELLHMFRHLFDKEKSSVNVSCSIGIASYPRDGHTFKELYASADKALYQAKLQGKDCAFIYDPELLESMGQTSYSSLGTAIDSEKRYAESSDNLTRFVFRTLYQSENIDTAIYKVLETVGKQYDVSRAYVFENSDDNRFTSNTYEWCNKGIKAQIDKLQNVNYEDFGDYEKLFGDDSIFYCRNIHTLSSEQEELFASQGIHSTLQCAFYENRLYRGFVGFDECTGLRLWTQEEISSLSLISQLLSIFLQRKKTQQINQEMIQYQTVLNSLDECIYVIEEETSILLYANQKFRETYPGFMIGSSCCFDRCDTHKMPIIWHRKHAFLCIDMKESM